MFEESRKIQPPDFGFANFCLLSVTSNSRTHMIIIYMMENLKQPVLNTMFLLFHYHYHLYTVENLGTPRSQTIQQIAFQYWTTRRTIKICGMVIIWACILVAPMSTFDDMGPGINNNTGKIQFAISQKRYQQVINLTYLHIYFCFANC